MWKRTILVPIVVLATAAVLLFTLRSRWTPWQASGVTQQTDDANVRSDQTPLSTRVSGTVRTVQARDYQSVAAGQLLVQLDDSDYQAVLSQAKAALAGARAEYSANQNAKRAADAAVAASQQAIEGAQAAATAATAAIAAAEASDVRAVSEYHRQQTLLDARAATRQQFEEALVMRDRSVAELDARRAELLRAQSAVTSADAARIGAMQQRAALNAKDDVLRAEEDARKAAIAVAEVNLAYTRITAPVAGRLGEFRVHPGQLVGAGLQVVDLVQSGAWVQANFRETQLSHTHMGDPAEVRVDALPGTVFQGHVAEIAPASGSQFALLPPDNATGNYTRIVQRVPVRIELEPSPALAQLRAGFSADVKIHPREPAAGEPQAGLR